MSPATLFTALRALAAVIETGFDAGAPPNEIGPAIHAAVEILSALAKGGALSPDQIREADGMVRGWVETLASGVEGGRREASPSPAAPPAKRPIGFGR